MNDWGKNLFWAALAIAILWFVIVQGVSYERFTTGGAKITKEIKR